MRSPIAWTLLLSLSLFSSGQDLDSARRAALAGDEAYEAGDYEGAVAEYEQAIADGIDHADLHFNLGNAHYKAGELGPAIASYERALLRSPRHASARSNLEQARLALRDEALAPLGLPLFLKPLAFVYDNVALNEWALLALLAAFLAALVAMLRQWFPPLRARLRGVLLASLLICAVGLALATLRSVRDYGRERAVVLVEEAEVRSGPGEGYNVSFKIHEGLTVFVSERREEWAQIHLGGKLVGWVPLSEIEVL